MFRSFGSIAQEKSSLLSAITKSLPVVVVSSSYQSSERRVAPTTFRFSHQGHQLERTDKKPELLWRATSYTLTTSLRQTGFSQRIHKFDKGSESILLRGFRRSYSCDRKNNLSNDTNKMARDPAADQLSNYFTNRKGDPPVLLTGNGAPIANKTDSLTVGPRGPLLIQDFVYLDEMSHFNRERIPERVVHAKGAGAFGYFEVTHDISQYTKAKVFSGIGKRTPVAARFSTVGGESGSADTVRDPRGFAVKFYTEEGIWDLVGNNTPVFFVKDPLMFPSFIHTQKRNPVTHLKDADMFWDFITLRPETTHQVSILFSDRGIPDGHRHMNGYGSHTFKLVNANDEMVWCKFHYKTNQGIKNIFAEKAAELASTDPDYSIRDLYNAIANEDYPSWTFSIQVMTLKEAETFRWNPFDVTKVWPHKEFPLIPVGRLVLDRNPDNYFSDVEQLAFDPAHMPPGIEPSPDKMLQGRLFAYGDTHRHRLGPNHLQLAVNCPYKKFSTMNYQRDGLMTINSQNGAPNYFPNSFGGPLECPGVRSPSYYVAGNVDRHSPVNEDDFSQPRALYQDVFDDDMKTRFVNALVNSLLHASKFIVERALKNFSEVDMTLGKRLTDGLNKAGKNINISGKSANL